MQTQPTEPTPLTPWGGFTGRRRISLSPYIETVWEGVAHRDDVHLTAADGTIDLTFLSRQGAARLLLSGPTSRVRPTYFKAEDQVLTVRLRAGVFMPHFAGPKTTDAEQYLGSAGNRRFWIQGTAVAFPSFDNTETFILHLARLGLLRRDAVVEKALAGRTQKENVRTIQCHFLAVTGLTMSYLKQIKRAEHARSLLTGNDTLTAIAYETGYSNPGHMTNAFKYFFGRTPSALRTLTSS